MTILETMLLGMATNGVYDFTREVAVKAFDWIRQNRSDLITQSDDAARCQDDAALRAALSGALIVAAESGNVLISGATISAVSEASFDHQHGTIIIGKTKIYAPTLVTGGSDGASGTTKIDSHTVLRSSGTSIVVGHGAAITMTGAASIKQT